MLGRTERESSTHALLAARQAQWDEPENRDEPSDLLNLGSMTATLATVASIAGLNAVVHIGHPAQPDPDLERALLASPAAVSLTAATCVNPQWAWVSRSSELDGNVVVDEAAMRDCRYVLRELGATPHLIPARMPLAERIALAGEHGSLVVESSNIPDGFSQLRGSERLSAGAPLWYGLVSSAAVDAGAGLGPGASGPAQVWLAFGPREEHRGSLQETLGLIAAAGIDLQHLRSQRATTGTHVFFAAFNCADGGVLSGLRAELAQLQIAHRVLAVFPGESFTPGPQGVAAQWSQTAAS